MARHPEQLPRPAQERYATRWPWTWIGRRGPEDFYGKSWLAFAAMLALVIGACEAATQPTAVGAALTGFTYCCLASCYLWLPRTGREQYRRGYWDARLRLWASMGEAIERGMTPDEWLQGEMDRDTARIIMEMNGKR